MNGSVSPGPLPIGGALPPPVLTGSEPVLVSLLNKTLIRSNLTLLAPDVVATKAQGLDYVLGYVP